MSKNEVVENVDEKINTSEEVKIREDLNSIVDEIRFRTIKSKYGDRHVCILKIKNKGPEIEFKDSDGLFELFQSYVATGDEDFLKSKTLVEEEKKDEEGNVTGTYICIKYELKDGSVYRLFTTKFLSNKIIINYYNKFKSGK